jgi:hypothetical protein
LSIDSRTTLSLQLLLAHKGGAKAFLVAAVLLDLFARTSSFASSSALSEAGRHIIAHND